MEPVSPSHAWHIGQLLRRILPLAILGTLTSGCLLGSTPEGGSGATATIPSEAQPTTAASPPQTATVAPGASEAEAARVGSLDFCFSFPKGYTLLPYGESIQVVGPQSDSIYEPGMMWIDVSDARGRTAEDVAEEELRSVDGLNPPRSIVMLGGEQALVLDGMPGQNPVRRVYLVHGDKLIIPTFAPYGSANALANDQMESLYAAVTSSWVWISSGAPCSPGN